MEYKSLHIGLVNGMATPVKKAISNLEYVRALAPDFSTSAVYNGTHGLFDLLEACVNIAGVSTRPTTLFVRDVESYFKNCPDGVYLAVCYSQGTSVPENAKKMLPPEISERIHVVALSPSKYVNDDAYASVQHLASENDPIRWIDLPGKTKNKHTTLVLRKHKDASFFDHDFTSPTLQEELYNEITRVRNKFENNK